MWYLNYPVQSLRQLTAPQSSPLNRLSGLPDLLHQFHR